MSSEGEGGRDRQADRQTDRQTESQRERQRRDRQNGRQTERNRERKRQKNRYSVSMRRKKREIMIKKETKHKYILILKLIAVVSSTFMLQVLFLLFLYSTAMPEAVHSCFPEAIDGGFPGNVTRCNCSLTSDGYPSGAAQWFRGDRKETNVSDGVLLVTKNDCEPFLYVI